MNDSKRICHRHVFIRTCVVNLVETLHIELFSITVMGIFDISFIKTLVVRMAERSKAPDSRDNLLCKNVAE